jgi:hypothetical protein
MEPQGCRIGAEDGAALAQVAQRKSERASCWRRFGLVGGVSASERE